MTITPGIDVSTDVYGVELTYERMSESYEQYIQTVAEMIERTTEAGYITPLVIALTGAIPNYYFIMQRLKERGFTRFAQVPIIFSNKVVARDGGEASYIGARAVSNDGNTSKEKYVIRICGEYDPEEVITHIMAEDLSETGGSRDATEQALREVNPEATVMMVPASVKVLNPANLNGRELSKRMHPIIIEGATVLFADNWLLSSLGLDGGETKHLAIEDRVQLEVLERTSLLPLAKMGSEILKTPEEVAIYRAALAANSMFGEGLAPEQVKEFELYQLLEAIIRTDGAEERLDVIANFHGQFLPEIALEA